MGVYGPKAELQIVTPPSMTRLWPVMNDEAGDARYTAAPAISSGSPMRLSGVVAVRFFSASGSSHSALQSRS